MLFVFAALVTAAAILIAADPKRSSTRWLSLMVFSGALGSLAVVIDYTIYPYVEEQMQANRGLLPYLYGLQAFSSLASYYVLPYAFLMFAVRYRTDVSLHPRLAAALPLLLLLPIALCLAFTPGYQEHYAVAFPVMAAWAVPYVAAGTALLLGKREVNRVLRRGHLALCLALLPPVIAFTFLNYIMQSLGYIGAWRYNIGVVAAAFFIFIYSIFRYGFMGVQFLVQTRRLDSTLRAVTSGTAILNHSIKNDIGKMRLFGEKIRAYAERSGLEELRADIGVVLQSADHIQEMVARVHERTQELPVRLAECDLRQLCGEVLASLAPELDNIEVELTAPEKLTAVCDRAQTAEVLTNIVRNAIEAMPEGGKLLVKLYETKRTAAIEMKDTGRGIDRKELRRVFEPFYTTKGSRSLNFGLGLAYCYSVMRKQGGSIDLYSAPGQGATVSLSFPKQMKGVRGAWTT